MRKWLIAWTALYLLFVTGCDVEDDGTSDNEDATAPESKPVHPLLAAEKATEQAAVEYVDGFYKALELTQEENQRAYEEGSGFDKSVLRAYLDDRSRYSRKRLEKLTGGYHYHTNIELLRTDSVRVGSNTVVLETAVVYQLSEVGSFLNAEKVTINRTGSGFIVRRWDDLRLIESQLKGYEGLENFGPTDFYKTLGSLNK